MRMNRPWRSTAAGAAGGVVGGSVMTLLMTQVAPRLLPHAMLPARPVPLRVIDRAEELSGVQVDPGPEKAAALAAHVGYSAASGAIYGLVARRLHAGEVPVPLGAGFGLLVWAASFQGLLPALGVMPRTTQHPPERWPAPLIGHAVFGIVTAFITGKLERRLQC